MSFLETLFCDCLYHSEISNIKIKNKLLKIILDIEKNKKSDEKTNIGGFQKELECRELFLSLISDEIKKYKSLLNFNRELKLDNFWCNINYKNNYNLSHIHPKTYFSGVYYLKVPKNSGQIVFNNSNIFIRMHTELETACNNPNFNVCREVNPKEDLLLMFPSYLVHEVEKNNSDDKRISISFNLIL